MSSRSSLHLALCLVLCLSIGGAMGWLTVPEIPTWYAGLVKPSWTPPNWLFGPVWTALYVLMAICLWLLWDHTAESSARSASLWLFFLQLAFNAAWTPIFFSLHRTGVALVIIAALWLAIAATLRAAWRPNRTAALLLVPYLAWVTYASSLNAGVFALNG